MKLQTKLDLRRAAMRMRRVQTDPEVGVLIDALLEDDVERASVIAGSTAGRVTFDREAQTTGPMIAWAVRRLEDRVEYLDSTEFEYVPGNGDGDYTTFDHGDRFVCKTHGWVPSIANELLFFDDNGDQIYTILLRATWANWLNVPRSASPRYQRLLREHARPYQEALGYNLDLSPGTQIGSLVHLNTRLTMTFDDALERMWVDTASGEDLNQLARLM